MVMLAADQGLMAWQQLQKHNNSHSQTCSFVVLFPYIVVECRGKWMVAKFHKLVGIFLGHVCWGHPIAMTFCNQGFQVLSLWPLSTPVCNFPF